MKTLIVIAGPRCVGKSKVITDIKKNVHPDFFNLLNSSENNFIFTNMNSIDKGKVKLSSNMLIHYDFFRPYMRGYNGYKGDSIYDLLSLFENILFVTLVSPHLELLSRLDTRLQLLKTNNPVIDTGLAIKIKKLNLLPKIYQSQDKIMRHYNQWIDFCFQFENSNHFILLNSEFKFELSSYTNHLELLNQIKLKLSH